MKRLKSLMRQEPRMIGNVVILACMVLSLCILSLLKDQFCTKAVNVNLQAPMKVNLKARADENGIISPHVEETGMAHLKENPTCDLSGRRSDTCEIVGDVRIQGNSTTIILPTNTSIQQREWKIRPYNRKGDTVAMAHTTELSLKPLVGHDQRPVCTQNHSIPAVIFSIGGYSGNLFHDFTDVLIPLFITVHRFHGEVQLITVDSKSWWLNKYSLILKHLSNYDPIDLDHSTDTHCFPRVIIGTHFHKELGIDPLKSPIGFSILDFKALLRRSLALKREITSQIEDPTVQKPRLLIITRKKTRKFVNEWQMVEMARSLGYDVVATDFNFGTDQSKVARLVNSCDVMIGVHGAGLTNMVHLPRGAVIIQVIPFGGLGGLARGCFKGAAIDMGLKYMDYSIQENESSLIRRYPHDHPVLRDPHSVHKKGWGALKSVYLEKQNLRLNLGTLRKTLLEALGLLRQGI